MKSIGERIKHLRKTNNLTQKEFAKLINLSQGRLSELEKDKTKPSSETLISIYQQFKISINWLLTGEKIELESTNDDLKEYIQISQELKEKGYEPKEIKELIKAIEKFTKK
ncbi:helix-turn-helix transcriptional regulator [Wukongibacter baidiensis]|uniref:helix-turn-helix domain-containing protein n=1 Tax=Wukongibacter baidiensis TaxID=1723361 RepID=UPI003D7F820B